MSTAPRLAVHAAALLRRLGLEGLSPQLRMGDLSHHVQRLVEIARAMNGDARVLIMDEPTAALAARRSSFCSASSAG